MEAPAWVTAYVEDINPRARLAWWGKKNMFALLELLPSRIADYSIKDTWDEVQMGTIYGSAFDRLTMIPKLIDAIPPIMVMDGTVISYLKQICRPPKKSKAGETHKDPINEHNKAYDQSLKAERENLYGEFGEELHWRTKKSDEYIPAGQVDTVATKHDEAVAAGDVPFVDIPTLPDQKAAF